MDLGGGSGDLKSILLDYLRNLSPYKNRKPFAHMPVAHPIILLVDNDNGLQPIGGSVKKNFGLSITTDLTENFYFITENLYLIKTPEANGQSCIEDLFPPVWKKQKT